MRATRACPGGVVVYLVAAYQGEYGDSGPFMPCACSHDTFPGRFTTVVAG
jgi:hypothetical protein